jgi:hypothetical protein
MDKMTAEKDTQGQWWLFRRLRTDRLSVIHLSQWRILMKDTQSRELYSSPNGDRWHLCKDASGRVFVLHQANIPSGGQTSRIELGDFLTRGYGPELIQMIGTLIESTPGELLTGEGNPGLAVSGGGGHP